LLETRPPVVVADHRDEVSANGLVVFRRQQSAERGVQAEHRKVAARHEQAVARKRRALVAKAGAEVPVGGDAGERGLHALEIAEHRVAENLVAAAGLAAGIGPRLRPRRAEVHQLVRARDRKRPQKHLVEERENRRIGADPEGQREDRDRGHERRFEQGAQGQANVGHDRDLDEWKDPKVGRIVPLAGHGRGGRHMDISQVVAAVIWLYMLGLFGFALYRLKKRRAHIGSAAAGTVYDIIHEDKRKAIEVVVADKASARDFERGEDDKDDD
jgi:hypothetical protein